MKKCLIGLLVLTGCANSFGQSDSAADLAVHSARQIIGTSKEAASTQWSKNVIELLHPYANNNSDAAFLYGLAQYPENANAALKAFRYSASRGNPAAMLYAASLEEELRNDPKIAQRYYEKASRIGCPLASHLLNQKEGNLDYSNRNLELETQARDAGGVDATLNWADFISDFSVDEAAYWQRVASYHIREIKFKDTSGLYDLNFACRK